jgi:hypothetical protein
LVQVRARRVLVPAEKGLLGPLLGSRTLLPFLGAVGLRQFPEAFLGQDEAGVALLGAADGALRLVDFLGGPQAAPSVPARSWTHESPARAASRTALACSRA